jgi:hypothetical protein
MMVEGTGDVRNLTGIELFMGFGRFYSRTRTTTRTITIGWCTMGFPSRFQSYLLYQDGEIQCVDRLLMRDPPVSHDDDPVTNAENLR